MVSGNQGFHVGGNVGDGAFNNSLNHSFNDAGAVAAPTGAEETASLDVGVLTVLAQETLAMVEVFQRARNYRRERRGAVVAHLASFASEDGHRDAVLMQTLDRGQRSAAAAYANLRQWYRPRAVALVGIAGGINENVDVGDVVIANQIIYYDERRVSAGQAHRRGEASLTPAGMKGTVNHLFSTYGEPFTMPSPGPRGEFKVLSGPIGTGGAVVTDSGSDIRAYLQSFNEKCLAVETEAGGLVQAAREDPHGPTHPADWLVIRAISDHADEHKGHRDHDLAARHAARVFERVVPLLVRADDGGKGP